MAKKVPSNEAARIWGVDERTIRRWVEAGKIPGEIVKSNKGGGKGGMKLMVIIDDGKLDSRVRENDKKEKDHTRVHRGEPGCHLVTPIVNGEPNWIPAGVNPGLDSRFCGNDRSGAGMTGKGMQEGASCESIAALNNGVQVAPIEILSSTIGGDPVGDDAVRQLSVGIISESPPLQNLPALKDSWIPASAEMTKPTNSKLERIANLRFALVSAFQEEAAQNHRPRAEIIQKFLERFTAGLILPDLKEQIKKFKRSTLYNWLQLYDQGGINALVPQYRGAQATPIGEAEKKFLLTKLLDQNKPTIGDSINKCKFLLGEASPSSPAKLRRFVNDFRKNNHDIWVLEREGEKALNDKCAPYAEREWRDLTVGEAVVADGHKLNFQVINPFTGRPCRAIMVMFWDWKSAYPLGWEIMLTESIQCVLAALRNSIITLGKFPNHALLDNGKAFRANIFRQKFRFQETEIPGIFDKLNIKPHFAMPYNAQSKPIERFFRIFNDWFERELPSYSGASINDKPAHMSRNEKRAKDLHDKWVPTIPEAMELIFRWREYYIDQPSRARDGQRPRDIFEAEKGPGVDPFALHFLMMTCKARMVHRNGITFNGWHWFHENLYGLKDYVLMFYSYYDLSQVYIFTMQSNGGPKEFLCVAKPVEKVKAFASDSEFPEDMAAVKQINATKRKCVQTTKKLADMLQSQKNLYIDWNRKFRDQPEVAEAIQQIEESNKQRLVKYSPFSDEPAQNLPTLAPRETAQTVSPDEPMRPRWKYDFEKYDWLMGHLESITEIDRKWIDEYQYTSSAFKNSVGGGQ